MDFFEGTFITNESEKPHSLLSRLLRINGNMNDRRTHSCENPIAQGVFCFVARMFSVVVVGAGVMFQVERVSELPVWHDVLERIVRYV